MRSGLRLVTLAAFALIAAITIFAAFDRGRVGVPNVTLVPENAASNDQFVVTAARAGPLRVGDHVAVDDPGELAAFMYHSFPVGATLRVVRVTPAPVAVIEVPIVTGPHLAYAPLLTLIALAFLSIAAFVVVRSGADGSLSFGWLLALLVLILNPTTPAWPRACLVGFVMVSGSISVLAFFCATSFATHLCGDPRAPRIRLLRLASAGVAVFALVLSTAVSADSFIYPSTPIFWSDAVFTIQVFQALILLTALGVSFVSAPAGERARVAWVVASIALGAIGFSITLTLGFLGVSEPTRDYPLLLLVAMPAGCAYAILRYRLLDIAFVVNRATVFGITSLLILAALALVDYGLQALLGTYFLKTGVYVQLGLALAIGIATRPIHHGVDRLVDDLFFRRRHETERALRAFARDVAYIDDVNVVMQRTVDVLAQQIGARWTLLLVTDGEIRRAADAGGASGIETVERNDPAIVRLLATREPVDLHGIMSTLTGDCAFPLFARNRLLGVLVGGSTDGRAVLAAPDERDSVAAVATACGIALDLLRIEQLERDLALLRHVRHDERLSAQAL